MIKITRKFKVSNIALPFTINWNLPDCVKLLSSVITNDEVEATFEFCDEACLQNYNTISFTVIGNDGCEVAYDSIFDDVCQEYAFTQNGVRMVANCSECDLEFNAPTNQVSTYEWIYDTDLFIASFELDRISLVYNPDAVVVEDSSTLKVIATNKFGCVLESSTEISLCPSEDKTYNFPISCTPKGDYSTGLIDPVASNCNRTINYSTVEIISVNGLTNFSNYSAGYSEGAMLIRISDIVPIGIQKLKIKVLDCLNQPIYFTLCLDPQPCLGIPSITPFNYKFGCIDCEDKTVFKNAFNSFEDQCISNLSIDLENLIDGDINWKTFKFIPLTAQRINTNTSLVTDFGDLELDSNRNINFNYLGGLRSFELIQYEVEVNGIPLRGELQFRGSECGETPLVVNDEVCLLSNNATGYIDVTANDFGDIAELIVTEYPAIQVLQNGLQLNFIAQGYTGTTILRYKVRSSKGIESNIGQVTITVNDSNIISANASICLEDSINLDTLIEGNIANTWTFTGYTTEVTDIPGTNNSADYTIGDVLSLPIIEPTEAGIYTFTWGDPNSLCQASTSVNVEVIENDSVVDIDTKICITEGVVNLNELTNTTGGVWTDLNQTPVTGFDGVNFTLTDPGIYLFRNTNPSSGIYSDTACLNTFVLTLEVEAEPEEVATQCLNYCSFGPDPEIEPGCKTNLIPNLNPTTGCEYDLYEEMLLPSGSRIQLLSAPFVPIILNINNIDMLLTEGSFLPEGQALWKNGNAPLGTYIFRAFYGDACQKSVDFEVNIYKAVCQVTNPLIIKCTGDSVFNIISEAIGGSQCFDNTTSTLTLVSENIVGQGSSDYDLNTGDFNPVVPGEWVFNLSSQVIGTDGSCEACNEDATIRIIVNPLPGPGMPNYGTVCNDGTCIVDVYPDMFIPNQSILGTFIYDGYNIASNGVPGVGGWGGLEPTLNPGDISGPSYTFEGAAEGFYFFSNIVTDANGCTATSQTIVQVVAGGDAGTPTNYELCELNSECIILRDYLTGETAGGAWSLGGVYPNAFSNCDPGVYISGDIATFNTEGVAPGVYTFTYTFSTPNAIYPIFDGCFACTGSSATITITITEAVPAGGGSSQMVCN
jgi:hypothetical protein